MLLLMLLLLLLLLVVVVVVLLLLLQAPSWMQVWCRRCCMLQPSSCRATSSSCSSCATP
jgi:hypothetical protein